ncbi:MAG: TIGR03758 family integrating conjugative element protein [Gilliamella apicola]|nr:TIGR03758 family integrating conjugative element protein [Gilliamella apicola]
MNNFTENAFLLGADYSSETSFNFFTVILIGSLFLLAAYIYACVLNGLAEEKIKFSDAPSLLIRTVLIILIMMVFINY